MSFTRTVLLIGIAVSLWPAAARAENSSTAAIQNFTLDKILRHVYLYNPTLEAARAQLRSIHETYPQALAGWKPSIDAETSLYHEDIDNSNFDDGADGATTKELEISLTQPLYRGGRTTAETERSYAIVKAGYAQMLQKEQEVFLKTVTAYMNVIRDRTLLNLRINNEKMMAQELEATQERFKGGDVTRTDVKQAEARMARAKAEHVTASSDLEASRAEFASVVGFAPDETLYIPVKSFLPSLQAWTKCSASPRMKIPR